jgi:hypothetical protein
VVRVMLLSKRGTSGNVRSATSRTAVVLAPPSVGAL